MRELLANLFPHLPLAVGPLGLAGHNARAGRHILLDLRVERTGLARRLLAPVRRHAPPPALSAAPTVRGQPCCRRCPPGRPHSPAPCTPGRPSRFCSRPPGPWRRRAVPAPRVVLACVATARRGPTTRRRPVFARPGRRRRPPGRVVRPCDSSARPAGPRSFSLSSCRCNSSAAWALPARRWASICLPMLGPGLLVLGGFAWPGPRGPAPVAGPEPRRLFAVQLLGGQLPLEGVEFLNRLLQVAALERAGQACRQGPARNSSAGRTAA